MVSYPMLGITFHSSIISTQILVFTYPAGRLPNAQDHTSIEHATYTYCCGHTISLPPAQCSGPRCFPGCHQLKFLWSHLQLSAYPMLGITFLSSITPTQILVVTSPACRPPSARDYVSFDHDTHSNSCGHISILPSTQCSGSRFIRACHLLKFLRSHL